MKRTIGIDARTFDYPESLARGVGQYSLYFVYHVARLLPQVRFLLYSERGMLPDEASPLADLPNVTVDRVDAYDPAVVDLVHICDPMNDSSGFDSPLRIFRHDRTTVTFYDTNPIRFYFKEWKQLYINTYLRRLFMLVNSSCHLLAISEYTRRDLIDYSGIEEQRVTTVMAGFNKPFSGHLNAETLSMIKQRYGISKPYFLHIGALDTHKNFTTALAAFIDCHARHDIQLVVVGKMNEAMDFVHRTIEERAIPGIVFTGFVSAEALASLYRGAAGTLFLSSCEGFGFPVLEAFANCCPVITTNVTSIPEVAGDAAIFCEPLNVPQVVAAMERLLTDLYFADQLRQRGENRAKVFTWENVAERAVAVWEDMLGISLGKGILSQNPQNSIASEQAISGAVSQAELTSQLSISWQGGLFANQSLAHVNRELCQHLLDKGFVIFFEPTEPDSFVPSDDSRFRRLNAIRNLPLKAVDITIRHHWPPDFNPPIAGHFIMIQPWEFGSLPKSWIEPMNSVVDEVWVPSSYVKECYVASGVEAERVQVVPNGVDTGQFNPDTKPYPLATDKAFRFLFVGGTIHRKGIDLLLGAYRTAFSADDDVCLVIKDMGGSSFYQGQTAQELISRFRSDPQAPEIEYIDKDLSTAEIASLYKACHCLVHPYRGEGFGLPIAEAMACGLAPIVTGYGAALDFCPPEIAWLVPAKVEKLPIKQVGQLETVDYPWLAEPDFDALVMMLRHAEKNPEEVRRRGRAAADFIHENYTWEHAARIAGERLLAAAKRPIRRLGGCSDQRPSGEQSHIVVAACRQAEQLAQAGKVDQAVQLLLNQGIRVAATDPRPYVTLAELLVRAGRYQDALEVLPEMPVAVDSALKLELAAVCHCALGDAAAACQAALEAGGRSRALVVLGTLSARQGNATKAEQLFRQTVAADPGCGSGWLSLGMLLWGQGYQAEAWQVLKRAVTVDPLNREAAQILCYMSDRLNQQFDALGIFASALDIHPDCRHLGLLKAELLAKTGYHAEALAASEAFLVRFGADEELLTLTSELRRQTGVYDRVVEGSKNTISLCMIVKDEEACLARCLASAKPAVHELVVVDTGSTDRTVAIATAFGARVVSFSWNGSFADARNHGLYQARGSWVLVLDADEVIAVQDHAAIDETVRSSAKGAKAFSVLTRNYTTMIHAQGWTANDGSYPAEERAEGWQPSWKVRLFPRDHRFRFKGEVHEMVEASLREAGVPIEQASFVIHHYGELEQDPVRQLDKKLRYFETGMQKLAQQPDDLAAICELAVQAGELGRFEEGIGLWDRVLEKHPDYVEALFNKGYCLMGLQRYDEALVCSRRGLELAPNHKEAAFNYGTCELYVGDPQRALVTLLSVVKCNKDYPLLQALCCVLYLCLEQQDQAALLYKVLREQGYAVDDYIQQRAQALKAQGRHLFADRLDRNVVRMMAE